MSTIVARRYLASPVRLSSAVWREITLLIAQADSSAQAEFDKVKGVASNLINEQALENYPLVVKNKGPRLRVYCLYGENAMDGGDQNEDSLSWNPTANAWHAFLPCLPSEVEEMKRIIAGKSKKFTVYDIEQGMPDAEEEDDSVEASKEAAKTTVNWGAFNEP
jgi:hypothetical protein